VTSSTLERVRGLGAIPGETGVVYRVWAPKTHATSVEILALGGESRRVSLAAVGGGYFEGVDAQGRSGDRYRYLLEGHGSFPDPVSRAQERDVHGFSVVVDPTTFEWSDESYSAPAFRDLVVYELHVGTFTEEGTFLAAIERLDHLRKLGVTAIEIMPIADFPGDRNWGYDGVLIYAPARCYGSPEDLRMLVDAAHGRGIAVILDVVYNHFGPDGNYLARFSDQYFSRKHHTPWGAALNFDGEGSGPVREFFKANPV
jgi:maltooligosyltrehalose trehalohydrolase